jgi:hypothetical protein
MKKLTLDIEALDVESFHPAAEQASRGTVVGADAGSTIPPYCISVTCGDSHVRACLDAG